MNYGETSDTGYTHIVVGDGLTAAAFVETCSLSPGDTLLVIGANVSALGRGAAYAREDQETPWRYAYLLNSPADDIDPEFARWIVDNWSDICRRMDGRRPDWLAAAQVLLDKDDTYGLNVPRCFYGDFMEEKIKKVLNTLRDTGVQVSLIAETALSVCEQNNRIAVSTDAGNTYVGDALDIAPGGPQTQRMDGDEGPFSAATLFGNEARIAEHIKAGAEVFCIGSNATMLDALRLSQSVIPEAQLKFVACSSDGVLPAALVPRLPRHVTVPELSRNHATAQSFLKDVKHAMDKARAAGDQMREMRAGFRAFFITHGLAQFLPDQEQAREVPKILGHWFRGGTRDTIGDFHRLMDAGKTRIVAGRVFAVENTDTGARVHARAPDGTETVYDTGFVINCSGAGAGSTYDPLTNFLIAQNIIKICPISRGIEVQSGCATALKNTRYLSPAITVVGDEVMPMPLYDAHFLRTWAKRTNATR